MLRLGDAVEQIELQDMTASGCRFFCEADLPPGAAVSIGIAGVGHTPARIAWRSGASYGCAFDRRLPAGAVTTAVPDNVARIAHPAPVAQAEVTGRPDARDEMMLSLRARVAIITGLTGALWSAIIGLVRAIL